MPPADAADFVGVDRSHGDVADAQAREGGAAEEVVWISVTRPEAREVEPLCTRARERGVPALGVVDREPGGEAGEPAEDVIADEARERHPRPRARPREAVAFDVLGLARGDGSEELHEVPWIHLSIAAHDDDRVRAGGESAPIPGHERRADTAVLHVGDDLDPGVADRARACCGFVGRGIVDDDHLVDERGDVAERARRRPREARRARRPGIRAPARAPPPKGRRAPRAPGVPSSHQATGT